MEHRRIRSGGAGAPPRPQGLTRSRIRNGLWLIAVGSSVALMVAAASFRSPGTDRAVRVASQTGTVSGLSQPGGGPGGPMAAGPAGSSGSGSAGSSSGSAGDGSGWDGSGGWSGGSAGWGGSGGSAGAPVSGNSATETAATSQNWAGYAAAAAPGTFTSVSSSWTEPAVTCTAQQTFSSFWVGLDGDGSQTVEQTGAEADCSNGAATYQGWFEMFPNAPVFYNNRVAPGDAMSASVVANGGGAFTLILADQTQGWTQTTNQTSVTAQLGSAEIIAEAPSDAASVLPLSNFGTVNFTGAQVDNAALAGTNPAELTMVSAAGVTEATPSALSNGDSFSVTWDSNGTAASPAPASAGTPSPVPTVAAAASTGPAAGTGTSPTASVSTGDDGWHQRHQHGY